MILASHDVHKARELYELSETVDWYHLPTRAATGLLHDRLFMNLDVTPVRVSDPRVCQNGGV